MPGGTWFTCTTGTGNRMRMSPSELLHLHAAEKVDVRGAAFNLLKLEIDAGFGHDLVIGVE